MPSESDPGKDKLVRGTAEHVRHIEISCVVPDPCDIVFKAESPSISENMLVDIVDIVSNATQGDTDAS